MSYPLVRDLAAEGFPVRLTCGVLGFSTRHETYRVHWRVFSTERRSGRARAWLADQGYDAVP